MLRSGLFHKISYCFTFKITDIGNHLANARVLHDAMVTAQSCMTLSLGQNAYKLKIVKKPETLLYGRTTSTYRPAATPLTLALHGTYYHIALMLPIYIYSLIDNLIYTLPPSISWGNQHLLQLREVKQVSSLLAGILSVHQPPES